MEAGQGKRKAIPGKAKLVNQKPHFHQAEGAEQGLKLLCVLWAPPRIQVHG